MKKFFQDYLRLFKQIALPLFCLTIFTGTFDQSLTLTLEEDLRSPDGATKKIWGLAAASLLNSLLFPWLMTLVAIFALQWQRTRASQMRPQNLTSSFGRFIGHYAEQSLIEIIRAWGKALLYSFLLILPGIWKYFEYTFIPWIVCFHPQYDEGKVDALKVSSKWFRKVWYKLLPLLILTILVPTFILTSLFEEYRLIWVTPLPSLSLHFVDTLLHILYFQILSYFFFRLLKEENHGLSI